MNICIDAFNDYNGIEYNMDGFKAFLSPIINIKHSNIERLINILMNIFKENNLINIDNDGVEYILFKNMLSYFGNNSSNITDYNVNIKTMDESVLISDNEWDIITSIQSSNNNDSLSSDINNIIIESNNNDIIINDDNINIYGINNGCLHKQEIFIDYSDMNNNDVLLNIAINIDVCINYLINDQFSGIIFNKNILTELLSPIINIDNDKFVVNIIYSEFKYNIKTYNNKQNIQCMLCDDIISWSHSYLIEFNVDNIIKEGIPPIPTINPNIIEMDGNNTK